MEKEIKQIQSWVDCTKCGIACRNKVFSRSDNNLPIKYLFIGEAPSGADSIIGKPFSGPEGKVLSLLLDASGCTNYVLTHLIACYPSMDNSRSSYRKPRKEEIENCKERLDILIEMINPKFYIALGKTAKNNPPSGITYHLELDHPYDIQRQSENKQKVSFNRNKNRLRSFIREHNDG